jgi:hypothetical protein
MLTIYILCGVITFWYCFDSNIIIEFFITFLQGIVIGLISNNICYLTKTNFAFLFVFFVYIILSNIIELNIFSQILNVFFPAKIDVDFVIEKLLLLMNLYFLTGFCLFKRQENY